MRLGSPVATFTVVMAGLIIALALSFVLPLSQTIAIPLLAAGSWLILLGIKQEAKPHELLVTTPSLYVIYGGLMLTISATYLAYINVTDVRVPLILFILGITLTVVLSHEIGKRKRLSQARSSA